MHACSTSHLDRKSSSLLVLVLVLPLVLPLLLLACLQFEVRESCVAQPAKGVVRLSSPRSSSQVRLCHIPVILRSFQLLHYGVLHSCSIFQLPACLPPSLALPELAQLSEMSCLLSLPTTYHPTYRQSSLRACMRCSSRTLLPWG